MSANTSTVSTANAPFERNHYRPQSSSRPYGTLLAWERGSTHRTTSGSGMTSTGTNFEPTYFARQATKSDAKLRWQYERMLSFAGTRLYSSSRVLDIGCGAAPGLRYLQSRG